MSRDRHGAERAALRHTKRVIDRRKEAGLPPLKPPPHPVTFAVAGTHRASDGRTYTITYDQPEAPKHDEL